MQPLNWISNSKGYCLISIYLFIYLTSHISSASPLELKQWSPVDTDKHLSSYLLSATTLNRRDEDEDHSHHMSSSEDDHMDHSASSHDPVEWVPTPPNSTILDQAPDQETRDRWSTYDATSYFTWPEHRGLLFAQFIFILLAWGFAYPVTLAMSAAESPLYIPAHLVFLGFYGLSLFTASVYNGLVPNMYPGSSYPTFLIVATILVICHFILSVFRLVNRYLSPSNGYVAGDAEPDDYNTHCYMMHDLETSPSGSSASTAAPSTPMMSMPPNTTESGSHHQYDSPDGSVASESTVHDQHGFFAFGNESISTTPRKCRWLFGSNWFEGKIRSRFASTGITKTRLYRACLAVSNIIFPILNLPLFILGMWHFSLALVIYNCMGKDKFVFSLLAHFIKGGVFFLYGLFALSRYLGVCADYGWAWNLRPMRRIGIFRGPTMEFVESGLIFTYGISNVFLERLGNDDGIWNHKDLQHVSIAFMYFGGGLCGLLVESKKVRRILNKSTSSYRSTKAQSGGQQVSFEGDNEGCFSFNPFPAFIVFWTGILMSKHSQEMALSTEIHAEWGFLFVAAAICRIITYLMYFVAPPTSTLPGRPLTELLTSFCLICGGLVFMSSNKETVPAIMNRGLDSMFTLNVTVGFSALIMAWEVIVIFLKNWAAK